MRYLVVLVALSSFVFATSVGIAQEAVETPIAEGPPGYCEAMPPGNPMPTRPTPADGHGICPTPTGVAPTPTEPPGTTPTPTPPFATPTPTVSAGTTPTPVPTPVPPPTQPV